MSWCMELRFETYERKIVWQHVDVHQLRWRLLLAVLAEEPGNEADGSWQQGSAPGYAPSF
jgi:hypothetical protein